MPPRTADEIIAQRLEKMRLGQAVCEVVALQTEPEERVALVAITEGEYQTALAIAVAEAGGNTALLDDVQKCAILAKACREVNDLTQMYYYDWHAVQAVELIDVNYIWDIYMEFSASNAPSVGSLSEEEVEIFTDVLKKVRLNELSGTELYAALRFLRSIAPRVQTDNSPGFSSIRELIETKLLTPSTSTANQSSTKSPAPSAMSLSS